MTGESITVVTRTAIVQQLSRRPASVVTASATLLEAGIVIGARVGQEARADLHELLCELEVDVAAFDEAYARAGQEASSRFGKGRHPAGLDLGDCFSYALARVEDAELLYVGDDFSQTDVRTPR